MTDTASLVLFAVRPASGWHYPDLFVFLVGLVLGLTSFGNTFSYFGFERLQCPEPA